MQYLILNPGIRDPGLSIGTIQNPEIIKYIPGLQSLFKIDVVKNFPSELRMSGVVLYHPG